MQSNYSNPESLAILASSIDQTLIETGRFFRSKGSIQSRAQLKRSLPVNREQFNLALDDLSEQIFMAKAFLERDYEALKATKAASKQPAEDVEMGGTEVKPEPEPEPESLPEPVKEKSPSAPPAPPAPTEAAGKPEPEEKATAPAEEKKPSQVTHVDLTEPQQEPDSEPAEINFDSVLNDSAGGANDFDLHLDFGDDDIGNQNFLSGSNMVASGIGSGTENPPRSDNNANTSIGGDAFDLELQKSNAPDVGTQGPPADGQAQNNTEEVMGPGQSSFDDLFMENDSMGDPNFLEGDGLMNINELDDSWFT